MSAGDNMCATEGRCHSGLGPPMAACTPRPPRVRAQAARDSGPRAVSLAFGGRNRGWTVTRGHWDSLTVPVRLSWEGSRAPLQPPGGQWHGQQWGRRISSPPSQRCSHAEVPALSVRFKYVTTASVQGRWLSSHLG